MYDHFVVDRRLPTRLSSGPSFGLPNAYAHNSDSIAGASLPLLSRTNSRDEGGCRYHPNGPEVADDDSAKIHVVVYSYGRLAIERRSERRLQRCHSGQ